VRVRDGLQDIKKQPDSRFDTEFMVIAVGIDVVAVNVFENEIWLSGLRYPSVDQFGYLRMPQTAKKHAFPFEALLAGPADERDVEKLDRYLSLKPPIVSLRQPDAAHTALTDLRDQPVSTEDLAGQTGFTRHSGGALLEKALGAQGVVAREQ
jgi:hypothetical protein